jgi:cyclase
LLIKDKGLVKTVNFDSPKYVGDPINAVRIFNEKQVDELIVLDIDATTENREPDYRMIENLAEECRMPICYGGGVRTAEQVQKIIALGVEKVAISSAAINNPNVVIEAAKCMGNQSIAIILDVKKTNDNYNVWIHNGRINTGLCPIQLAEAMESYGAGEIVINSIDNDGSMNGYDYKIINQIRNAVRTPITALGGAGSLKDIAELIDRYGLIGAAAGSIFVFKGIYRAVLINYPSPEEKDKLICQKLSLTKDLDPKYLIA